MRGLLDTVQTSCQVQDPYISGEGGRKLKNWALSQRYQEFDSRRALRVLKCARWITRQACTDHGHVRHRRSFLCGDRFCPICARKRSADLARRYRKIIEGACRGLYGHMLTLTYKNSETMPARGRIAKDVRNLLRRSLWKRHGGIVGGLYSVEVKRGEGGWHPHVHMLIFTRKPIASYTEGKREGEWLVELNQEVSDAWRAITGDSFIVQGETWDGNTQEVVKYMTKAPESLPPAKLHELLIWTRGMRSVSAFGSLYGVHISETVEQDHAGACRECGCLTFYSVVYEFDFSRGSYVVTKTMFTQVAKPVDQLRE